MHCCQSIMEVKGIVKLRIDDILAVLVDKAYLVSQVDPCQSLEKGAGRIELVGYHQASASVDIAPFTVLLNPAKSFVKYNRLTRNKRRHNRIPYRLDKYLAIGVDEAPLYCLSIRAQALKRINSGVLHLVGRWGTMEPPPCHAAQDQQQGDKRVGELLARRKRPRRGRSLPHGSARRIFRRTCGLPQLHFHNLDKTSDSSLSLQVQRAVFPRVPMVISPPAAMQQKPSPISHRPAPATD